MTRAIPLTQDQVALVDDCDWDRLMKHTWFAHWSEDTDSFYACREIWVPGGKRFLQRMHREIMGLTYGDNKVVDHENHNTLDNRRKNLKVVTRRENHGNRKDGKRADGLYKTRGGKYGVRIRIFGEKTRLGLFDTEAEALEERSEWLKMIGETDG